MANNAHNTLAWEIEARLSSDSWDSMIARRVLAAKKSQTRKTMLAAAIVLAIATFGTWMAIAPIGTANITLHDDLISKQINGTYASVFSDGNTTSNGNESPLAELDTIVDAALARR